MNVIQISVSLENVPGKLLSISEFLGTEGINIRAISVADTSDISTVRFVTDNPARTVNVLKSHGYAVKETEVIAVEVPDHPGGLLAVLKPLRAADINVLYLYPYLGRKRPADCHRGREQDPGSGGRSEKELGAHLWQRDLRAVARVPLREVK